MRIGIITYDCQHRKTEEVVLGLALLGHYQLRLFALPFVARKERQVRFPHRPFQFYAARSSDVAQDVRADFLRVRSPSEIPPENTDYFIICGAGLLSADFVSATRGRVINAHPGLIPQVRGLDSFKWAIHDDSPMGNTLHFIDEEADAGDVIATVGTPVFSTDTIESLAQRHYNLEIQMLINFERMLQLRPSVTYGLQSKPARMRMPIEIERACLEEAPEYIRRHSGRAS